MPELSPRLLVTDCVTSVPNASTRLSYHVTLSRNKSSSSQKPTNCCITALVTNETRTSRGSPLLRQKELNLVDLASKVSFNPNERRHNPDKEHFVHQKTTESRRGTFRLPDS